MKKMGANDWIKYGWGEKLNDEKSPTDDFYMDFSSYKTGNINIMPIDAAVAAIHEIAKSYPPPYTLMCSGGVDSQSMCYAWIKSKVPFNVVSIRYISNGIFFNEHDLKSLNEFSKLHNIPVEYKDFDLINFLENDFPTVVKDNDCDSPHICTYIKISEMIDCGTILYSGNIIFVGTTNINYTLLGLHRYDMLNGNSNRRIIPFFFIHDPVLAFSFHDAFSKDSDHLNSPFGIYTKGGFSIVKPPEKYTGFEKIKDYYDQFFNRVPGKVRLKFKNKASPRTFDNLFRHPYQRHGKYNLKCVIERNLNE